MWTLLHCIQGDKLRDRPDRALIALGMGAALRRSELVALRVEDLRRVVEELRIRIVRPRPARKEARARRGFRCLESWARRRPERLHLNFVGERCSSSTRKPFCQRPTRRRTIHCSS